MLKLHHATINKGVVFKNKRGKEGTGGREEETEEKTTKGRGGRFSVQDGCSLKLLAQVAVVAVVLMCVEVVVESVEVKLLCWMLFSLPPSVQYAGERKRRKVGC